MSLLRSEISGYIGRRSVDITSLPSAVSTIGSQGIFSVSNTNQYRNRLVLDVDNPSRVSNRVSSGVAGIIYSFKCVRKRTML